MKIGFKNYQQAGSGPTPAFTLDMSFDPNGCGCTPDENTPGVITWTNIQGKPECLLDCNVLREYIIEHGLTNLGDSDEIVVDIDENGINRMYLVSQGLDPRAYGSEWQTVVITVNDKGIVTAIEEKKIQIDASQVDYENSEYPDVTNVREILDQLVLFRTQDHYEHTQASAAMVWNIAHNMEKKPNITIIDGTGALSIGRIAYPDNNTATVTFTEAVSGKAFCN